MRFRLRQALENHLFRNVLNGNCSWKRDLSRLRTGEQLSIRSSAYVPESRPIRSKDIADLQNFVDSSSRIFILTGAGISTESGIPDYRSKDVGLYDRVNHRPMQHSEFMKSSKGRQRYWARNYIGWSKFIRHRPNPIHLSLADWERKRDGTQNVDALHTLAGTKNLTELHGCLNRVICLDCGEQTPRSDLQKRLEKLNPGWQARSYGSGPDADEFLAEEDVEKFQSTSCLSCGGALKPDVVFFGDTVKRIKVDRAFSILSSCDAMLVLGSSLHVWSGYRFVLRASEHKIPIACVNIGPTRGDNKMELKIDGKCGDIITKINI